LINPLFVSGAIAAISAIVYALERAGMLERFFRRPEVTSMDVFVNTSEVPMVLQTGTERWIIAEAKPLDKDMKTLQLTLADEYGHLTTKQVLTSSLQLDFTNRYFWDGIYIPVFIREEVSKENEMKYNQLAKENEMLKAQNAKLMELLNQAKMSDFAKDVFEKQKQGAVVRSGSRYGYRGIREGSPEELSGEEDEGY